MTSTIGHKALAELIDRQLIWDCLVRYIRGVDRMDLDLIRSAFWEDAHNSHGPVSGTVEEFIAHWMPGQAKRAMSFHLVSNQSVEFEGDTLAHCEAYFLGAFPIKGNMRVELVGGRYADLFEKRDDEWRIKTRLVLLDWQAMADSSEMQKRLATRHQGSRDRRDPTYERPVRPRAPIDTPWS